MWPGPDADHFGGDAAADLENLLGGSLPRGVQETDERRYAYQVPVE